MNNVYRKTFVYHFLFFFLRPAVVKKEHATRSISQRLTSFLPTIQLNYNYYIIYIYILLNNAKI